LAGTKRWPDAQRLVRFGRQRCQLTEADTKEIVADVADVIAQETCELGNLPDLDSQAN
jgi:hypothetical protein